MNEEQRKPGDEGCPTGKETFAMKVSFSLTPPHIFIVKNSFFFFFIIQHTIKNWLYSLEESSEKKTLRSSYYLEAKFVITEPKK